MKFKTISFEIYPRSLVTESFNKLIAWDVLILRITQRQLTFSIVIIVKSLILTLKINSNYDQCIHNLEI